VLNIGKIVTYFIVCFNSKQQSLARGRYISFKYKFAKVAPCRLPYYAKATKGEAGKERPLKFRFVLLQKGLLTMINKKRE